MPQEAIFAYLEPYAASPWLLAILLLLATFVLEDVATSAAALLAANGDISVVLAFGAVLLGIVLGDLGLFAAGRLAQRLAWVQRLLTRKGVLATGALVSRNYVGSILFARFMPGMRLPAYTGMGALKLGFKTFATTVVLAVGAWTSLLFWLVYKLGGAAEQLLGQYQWLGVAGVLLIAFMAPKLIAKVLQKSSQKSVQK